MPVGKRKKMEIEELQKTAFSLYKKGYTLREIGKALNRSHTWANTAVKKFLTGKTLDKKFTKEYNENRK